MQKIETILKKTFNWNLKGFIKTIIGLLLFAFTLNIIIIPMNLYNGGILGLAQLIRSSILNIFNLTLPFDIAGIINLIFNVPLFIIAFKFISKTFFARTIICLIIQTIFLTVIPVLNTPIINDLLTTALIGGILVGLATGLTLSGGGNTGGTDIIGIALTIKNRKFSVGKIGLLVNVIIYIICGVLYGLPIMIYSIIYAVFNALIVEKTHEQNICSTAIIFTKKKPLAITDYVTNELDRSSTYWEATGAYKKDKTYIIYIVLSKYELQKLERHLPDIDKNAFLVKSNGYGIDGNFNMRI